MTLSNDEGMVYYNGNGNMTTKEGTALVYDAENRLVSAVLAVNLTPSRFPLLT